MKASVACLALEFWFPVSCVVHVLIDSVLALELAITRIAFIAFAPMIECIHVLIHSILAWKFPIARIAFIPWGPMVECIHVLVDSVLALKLAITRVAFVFIVHVELTCAGYCSLKDSNYRCQLVRQLYECRRYSRMRL